MFTTDAHLATAVRARVIDALGPHLPADEARIAIDIVGTEAILRGCVHSWPQRQALGRAALRTPGITSVDNQLALLVEAHPIDPRFFPRRSGDRRGYE